MTSKRTRRKGGKDEDELSPPRTTVVSLDSSPLSPPVSSPPHLKRKRSVLSRIPKYSTSSNTFVSFRRIRERLDSIRPRRQPRGRKTPRDFRHSEGQSKHNLGDFSTLSRDAAKAERDRLCVRFPSATIDVKRYAGLNQGQDGACTLVALIHLFWLSGAEHLLSSSKSSLQRSWRTFWKPPNEDFDASPDIASTIDMSLSTGLLPSAAGLNYVPIRSEGNREQSFNESFWTSDTSTLMERYDVSSSSGDYEKIPYVYQNANLVESLLDEGHPIAINALEHSRVAVAYNDTHLLFADSWGPRHYETNKRGTDVTSAGFSVVDKWLIYSWMRDLAYVDDANAPEAVEAAQQMKRRRRSKRSRSVVEVVDLVGSEKVKMKNKPRRVRQRTSITRTRAKESECVDLVARDDDVDDDDGEMVKEKGRADASTRAGSSKWKEQQQRAEVTDNGEVFSWIARDNFRDELSSDDSEWEP